jgi:hypothetical protein
MSFPVAAVYDGRREPGDIHPAVIDRRYSWSLAAAALWFALAFFSTLAAAERDDWRAKMQPITPLGYVVRHAAKPPVIDGQLDDAAWSGAEWTSDFVDIEGVAKPRPRLRTRAKLLWDDNWLYVAAELEEPHVWATLTQHDSVIFQDPDFEVFIDPDGDTHAYYEFEINARNTSWDLHLPKPYMDGGSAQNDWEIPGLKSAVHVKGTLNDPRDTDRGWTVELALPWSAFAAHARHAGPPNEGEQWRLNFSRVEWRIVTEGGTYRKVPHTPEDNWVWSPQGVIDMHRPEMWGVLQFTRQPASELVAVAPIPGKAARDAALDVYHAQRDFFTVHERWAGTLDELGGSESTAKVALTPTADGYEALATFAGGAWRIQQDRKLTLETVVPEAGRDRRSLERGRIGARTRSGPESARSAGSAAGVP